MRITGSKRFEYLGVYVLPEVAKPEEAPKPALVVLHLAPAGTERDPAGSKTEPSAGAGRLVTTAILFIGKRDAVQGGGTPALELAACVPAVLN